MGKTWRVRFETVAVTDLQHLARVGTVSTTDAVSEGVNFHAASFVRQSAERGREIISWYRGVEVEQEGV